MKAVRIIILVLFILYLLLALIFMHITLSYKRQYKKSGEILNNLFTSQANLFAMLSEECGVAIIDLPSLENAIAQKDYKNVNKLVTNYERTLTLFLKENKCNSTKFQQIISGINENTTLIRNEVYRYNKVIENLNINRNSLMFALSVAILGLKELEKI